MLQPLPCAQEFPVIETPRLRLRHHRLEDFPACRDLWSDPAVTQFVGGRPLTEEEAWVKFLRNAGHWPLLGFGFWILEEKSTAAFAGEIGLAYFHRELIPPVENLREAGWILSPAMHGKGYATEAVNAVLAWGDARFSDPRTICLIHPDNAASIRVAQKCGFHEWHRATYRNEPTIVFQRTSNSKSF
jgi:RimJ/RimL family protein N-acetyltransferase